MAPLIDRPGRSPSLPLVVSACLFWLTSLAAVRADDVSGRVIEAGGKGVAGVKVWAIGRGEETQGVSARTVTDTEGRFTLSEAWKLGKADLPYVGVFARAEDGRCGWISTVWKQAGSDDLSITLDAVTSAPGQIVDQDGRPIAGCTLALKAIDRTPNRPGRFDSIGLPREIADPYLATTGPDGRFTIERIPRGARIQADAQFPGQAGTTIFWESARTEPIVLDRRLGTVRGRVTFPEGARFTGTNRLSVESVPLGKPGQRPTGSFSSLSRTVTLENDGHFEVGGLPPGRYRVQPELAPEFPYAFADPPPIDLRPGESNPGILIPLRRIPLITGRVIDQATGQGIEGVTLSAFNVRNNSLISGRQVRTDRDGRYRVAIDAGVVLVHPEGPPHNYMGLDRQASPKQEVKDDTTWPDFKLARAIELEGIAVDAAGKPLPKAEIHLTLPDAQRLGISGEVITASRPDGSFILERIDPDDRIPVRARTADATTDGPLLIRTQEQKAKGRLTVTLNSKFAFFLIGRVVDARGKPLANVPVQVWWSRQLVSEKSMKGMGLGSVLDQVRTDADGRFRTRAVWPGDRYKVTVQAEGFSKAESAEITGSAGQTHDFGTISLVDVSGYVAGRVVDTKGQPLAGARVFNRGDGPQPTETETSAEGRFRLEGLFSASRFAFARKDGFRYGSLAEGIKIAGRKYILVRKDGFRSQGMAVDGAGDDVTITLLRKDEPPPPWTPAIGSSADEQKALAKRVLVRLWPRYGAGSGWAIVPQMAMADLDLALKWSAEQGGRFDSEAKESAAMILADSDAPGALALLKASSGRTNPAPLLRLAARFAATDPSRARVFAEEAAKNAQAIGGLNQAGTIAEAGSILMRAGKIEEGRKLIEEAVNIISRADIRGQEAGTRTVVARALGAVDPARAFALIEPLHDRLKKNHVTVGVVLGLARSNPEKALELIRSMDDNSSQPQSLRTEVAFALAPEHPDRAIQIVESMKGGHGAEKYQAEAFGWLAVAVAPRDRAKAHALIERALALPIDKPEPFGSYTYFGGALASTAGIGLNARKIAYPDMDSVVMQMMATRPDGLNGFNDPAMQTLSMTIASPLVALLDPAAARTILGQLEIRSGLPPAELDKISGEWRLAAWALADLKHAERLVDAELSAMEGRKPEALGNSPLLRMTEVLLTPPDRREEFLRSRIGASWYPGFGE